MIMTKKELRQNVRELNRKSLTPEYRREASAVICRNLQALSEFQQAHRIGLFHALPDEPDLTSLFEMFGSKKDLYLPRVEGQDICFYQYHGEMSLSAGSFGISEPIVSESRAIHPLELELIVVPGMAFSPQGIRLGRGKAFYDRFLPQTKAFLVGCVFRFRLLSDIPCDPWDHLMDKVISD